MTKGRFRDREMKLGRRAPSRDPKHRLLVVCEGKKTEPLYFKAFRHHFRNHLVHVDIVREAGVPITAVARAIALREAADLEAKSQRDENLKYDEVWCVIDVDDHPNLETACSKAGACGIMIALSNPCFEVWALLHFRDHTESLHRDDVNRLLRIHLPNYGKELDFNKLVKGYDEAVSRARGLEKTASSLGQPRRNPTTSVFILTERIRTSTHNS